MKGGQEKARKYDVDVKIEVKYWERINKHMPESGLVRAGKRKNNVGFESLGKIQSKGDDAGQGKVAGGGETKGVGVIEKCVTLAVSVWRGK